ncbi:DUF3667 domain-containing protein [Flavobacterium sp.]|uniref:DUF3667 domain-containing protein n=1 Tax=Flavobacterium sp. TaxID=239 RepID=UPI0025F173A6|nr:DUF3667 domain-containing protein [Flavobacterium sp.]
MSRSPLRKDKTCLNCNYVVENRFCPNCGQENTDTRKTFHHLFIHFFEDLTHYENAFWKTIKNLFLKPASLTKEYLSGKRLSYLAPVRLYIFISFVTFFIIAIFPTNEDELLKLNQTTIKTDDNGKVIESATTPKKKIKLSEYIKADEEAQKKRHLTNEQQNEGFLNFGYKNVKELDSLQKYGPAKDKLNDFEYTIVKKTLIVKAKNSKEEMIEKFLEEAQHNFPKVLFIYMPLFALTLWLFHNKKRWYYFDHGIFTLHYFSFLLISVLMIFFFKKIMGCFTENSFTDFITSAGKTIGYIWMFYYFFPAHHRFYGETRTISFLKSITMFFINVILMGILLSLFIIYTFIDIH